MAEVRVATPGRGPRTGADLALLLDELNRLLRAFSLYEHGHRSRTNLLQRATLLWQLELEHGGDIEIERSGKTFCSRELGTIECGYLGRLVRAMEIHEVDRVRITRELDERSFTRFANLLAVANADLDHLCEGGFAGRLYAGCESGIEINDRPRQCGKAETEARSDSSTVTTVASEETATESSSATASEPPAVPIAEIDPIALAKYTAPERDGFAPRSAWPKLEEDPFEAPAMAMGGERLRLALRELDRCEADLLYDSLMDKIVASALQLWSEGQREEAYRALLVLTAHASGADGGSRPRALMAQSALERMVDREHLDFLVERGRDCEAGGVRPTQILLQLGEPSAAALLDALDRETDSARSAQLAGMILALGEHAVPTLIQTIFRRSGSRLQLAVRLAGQLQSPKLVPILASIFFDSGPALRREAGLALARIGSPEARRVLVEALSQDSEELARIAAKCLGSLGDDRAARPLLDALERALGSDRFRVARVAMDALGQLDARPEEVARALGRLFEPASQYDPGQSRKLKCAALELLGRYEGSEPQALLMAAIRDDDPAVRRRSHEIMNQRDRLRTG